MAATSPARGCSGPPRKAGRCWGRRRRAPAGPAWSACRSKPLPWTSLIDKPAARPVTPAVTAAGWGSAKRRAALRSSTVSQWRQRCCQSCPLREQCVPPGQKHRRLIVGEHHEFLQQRRQEQGSEAFQQQMHRRNAIEGTLSELARGHGMRRSRYRGFGKVELQNLLIGTACNIKRWLRRLTTKRNDAQARACGLTLRFQALRERGSGVFALSFWPNILSWHARSLPSVSA
jgi:hypothetical protein